MLINAYAVLLHNMISLFFNPKYQVSSSPLYADCWEDMFSLDAAHFHETFAKSKIKVHITNSKVFFVKKK